MRTAVASGTIKLGVIASAEKVITDRDIQRERSRKLMDAVQERLSKDRKSELDRLYLGGKIERRHLFAGEMFVALWDRIGLEPSVIGSLCGKGARATSPVFGIDRLDDKRLDALDRWKRLVNEMQGRAREELLRVCIFDGPAIDIPALRLGLSIVADYLIDRKPILISG